MSLTLGCADLTAPVPEREAARLGGTEHAAKAAPGADEAAADAPTDPRPRGRPGADADPTDRVAASHVLIAYQGARRARPNVTRSKAEALELAKAIATRARKGEDFGALAAQHSDEPNAEKTKGSVGRFERNAMVKPFSDAAFALKPGEVSDVVETDFGFHVIKRDG